jgi:hypothetical protein
MNLRNWTKAMVTLGLVGGLLLVPWPADAHAGGGEWEWQTPFPAGSHLQSVWGSSGSDVFAVGEWGTIVHYDGEG